MPRFPRRWFQQLSARSSSELGRWSVTPFRPLLEELAAREVPAVITVTTTVDTLAANDGVVSLREAITAANASSDLGDPDIIAQNPGAFGADTINFNIPGAGVHTITLTADLPALTDTFGVTIDGYSQPGASANTRAIGSDAVLLVELNGNNTATVGLSITSANNTVQGLVINRVNGDEISISGVGASANLIAGNFIGTDTNGTAGLGNARYGIFIISGAANNTVGGTAADARNVISGNNQIGVGIVDTGSTGNVVLGNYIGTDANGTADLGNTQDGVIIANDAADNTLGGTATGARNIISGNNTNGVTIVNPGSTGNVVLGNYIGTDANGTADLGNAFNGVSIFSDASDNTVGGTAAGARNVISGNNAYGVQITGAGATGNVVAGNYIGTDANGTADLGNTLDGVIITVGATGNTIGGTAAGARNVLSGNDRHGVSIFNASSTGNVVVGNYIGTDANGTADLGNSSNGVLINSAANNTIGGTAAGARNVISGNDVNGVNITSTVAATGNVVVGNYIGTDINGTADLGNAQSGVAISNNAAGNTVGGTTAGARNVISGNNGNGVQIADAGSTGNVVVGNYIGTDANGTADLGNTTDGVLISSGAAANTIGGTAAGARNVISGNDNHGVQVNGGSTGNVVLGNYIGTDANGTADLGNTFDGVLISSAAGNTVGGTATGARNVVSGNNQFGVRILNAGATGNVVVGNYIGTDTNGTADLGNTQDGVYIENAPGNTLGGTAAEARNVISGNNQFGVRIFSAGSTGNVVLGNYIGTDANGTADLGNTIDGVRIDTAANNTIGGTAAGARNVISGNDLFGAEIFGAGSTGNVVLGNYIGTDANGTADLGNTFDGVIINGGANNTVGGTAAGARNVISGNNGNGVQIFGAGATGNVVLGNYIGTDANGTADLGNTSHGILITNGAASNTVGGTATGARNVVSFNGGSGVLITNAGSTGNVVLGNYIGTDANGTANPGNIQDGVLISSGAANNTVGGTTAGARNVISGNDNGVQILNAGSTGNVVLGNFIGTDANGTADLGNIRRGVIIFDGANNTIGGTTAGARNVISGNDINGVLIFSAGATGNVVLGNYIGTDVNGTADLGNTSDGVVIDGAAGNTIGGTTTGARNVISGNDHIGVLIINAGSTGNVVAGNYIGTDANGTADLGNTTDGVVINGAGNTIGGTTTGARNVVSGNNAFGVVIGSVVGSTGNVVVGNYIGTDANGTAALGNTFDGVLIYGGAANNTVGGTTASARNVISGNDTGVQIADAGTTGNVVVGNYIGTDANGTADLGNASDGVIVFNGAVDNTIGGTVAGARNVISGNNANGVQIADAGTTGNVVLGNYIGTDANGTADLGNSSNGVLLTIGAAGNTIGGAAAGARNVISGNNNNGVQINGSTGNVLLGNYIGTDVNGTADLGNSSDGIRSDGGVGNTIGGTATGARNVISGNDGIGIELQGGSTGNVVLGNYIGTDASGTTDLGNTIDGVLIINSAVGNTIGGTAAGARNVISGNDQNGVRIFNAGATGNVVVGNYIGTDANGTTNLGNSSNGVLITNGAAGNTIGGTGAGAGNVIAFNTGRGVAVGANPGDTGATGNVVLGNSISDNGGLGIDLASDGVTPNGANPRAFPNAGQNTPVLTTAVTDGTSTTVTGTLTSAPNTTFRVELFSNPAGGTQGRTFLGFVTVTTDAAGAATFQFTAGALPAGVSVTATATATGGTSEFSALVTVTTVPPVSPPPPPAPPVVPPVVGPFVVAPGGGTILLGPVGSPTLVPFAGWSGEVRVATGDVTGDGVPDLVVGAGPGTGGGHVKVFDGQTGAEVASFLSFDAGFLGGVMVATGDIDGDGFADIIVGAGAGSAGGHVKVFSGRDGGLIRSFLAFDPTFLGGVAVGSGDVDGDGRADVLVVAGPATPAHVKAFSGRDGGLLQSFFAFADFAPALTGPATIAGGDLDGDGVAEIVVGSGGGATVRVFRGSARVAEIQPFVGYAGGVRVGAFDRDGDGLAELLVGVGPGGPGGHIKIFDGLTFAELDSFLPFAPTYTGGVFVG